MTGKHWPVVDEYARSILDGTKPACDEDKQKCERFRRDLENPAWEFRPVDADFVIGVIESTFVHEKGEAIDGSPMMGKPFLLEPFQKFHIYNLLGFWIAGMNERRFKEAYIEIPRKNAKTTFSAALAWALALLQRKSGSTVYITSAALVQSLQSWNFIKFNIIHMGEADAFRIIDNNNEHSIGASIADGSIYIRALAANPDRQDSLNCNIAIADELHAYTSPKQYNIIKEAMKAYTNKLMIGITTAGDNMNSFGYRRRQYCQKILSGAVTDDAYYVSISKAPEGENGDVDYTSALVHEIANPMYGITIRPDDIMNDALQAQNDPQQRKDFLAKSLNVYTAAMRAYFNLTEFQESNQAAGKVLGIDRLWSAEQKIAMLAKLSINWYGGTDLSKLHDLTAAVLYGEYKGVDIAIPHTWFPIVAAHIKAEEDGIPLFGWKDDGWLTMSNAPTINYDEVVNWYAAMKKRGFKIKMVGHDRRFAKEYIQAMKRSGFQIADQRQYDWVKVQGFRRIESKAKNGEFYYLGAEPFEYCLSNVRSVESLQEKMHYEKVDATSRIDVFDAAVMAACQMMDDKETAEKARMWL